jgi:hypothetical protein
VFCLAACGAVLLPSPAEAGTVVIPAWSFARGNVQIHADPAQYADAGPVVVGAEREPWGWTVEYDVELPVTARYTLQICYAAAEVRPVEVFLDGRRLGNWCRGVTFGPSSAGEPDRPSWKSSGAQWEALANNGKPDMLWRRSPVAAGKHTVKLASRGPLPHLVALRLDTAAAFSKDWKPPRYEVRDLQGVPAKYRDAFRSPDGVASALPPPVQFAGGKSLGSLTIPAWTFDRGNARIYASPDEHADAGVLAGGGPQAPEPSAVEYDIDFPATGDYTLWIRYAAAEARPVDVFLDDRKLGKSCTRVVFGTATIVLPARTTSTSRYASWERLLDRRKGGLLTFPVTKGKHTLKLARRGPLPNLAALRLDSAAAFPKGWKPPERKVKHIDRVPAPQRAAFLPPDAVNTAALRPAIEKTIETFGPRYAGGPEYLKQLAALEAKPSAEKALHALRRKAMLAHPLLGFDKLLFIKRSPNHYNHTYASQHATAMGGNLCVLSPVSPDGKVTPLVPELDGGLFDRFDLSFDARKVIFGYKKTPKGCFRIYEVDIDPVAGKMVPGSLRQLTDHDREEAEVMRRQICGSKRGFDDKDPCYLPNGRILFSSTRAQRIVFCAPNTAATLYLMDADGTNVRRLSESPISETVPSMLHDGRVIYTRWEYVDKGLGNAETLWVMRPDGSGSDHVYKLNTTWPAGMSCARAIPGSRRIVAVGGNHYQPGNGPVVLLDTRRSRRGTEAMHCVTPEIGYPHTYSPPVAFGAFTDPYPLSETLYLVSHVLGRQRRQKQTPYGLYVLDAWGNRAELYRDPGTSCFEPMPLRPRRRPLEIPPVKTAATTGEKTGTLFIQNIYEGMTGIERGRVKYVRVMGALEWPWDEHGISWSLGTDPHRKRVYGVAKVHEDGSAFFTAPADQNLFFQALDKDFMALQQMSTFINLMPGENRGCIGCHERRRKAPALATGRPLAMAAPPQALAPQPGDTGVRMVDFAADVQPTLDRHCIDCHGGKKPKAGLDLVGVPFGKFSRSYESLTNNNFVNYRACGSGRAHIRAVPPLTHGSPVSLLPAMLRKGHNKVKLTREEMIRLTTWIDANVPYYGTYRGRKSIHDKDHPDFRAHPLVLSARAK